jgi:TPP-dependent pyruvate/acetoin dehydrogenase alpha subunit
MQLDTATLKAEAAASLDTKGLLAMFRMMSLIREFENQVASLYRAGAVPGLVHLSAGQEATSAGICLALRPDDYIASHHRGHGHCLAKGGRADILLAEILGRVDGSSRGRGGSMHMFDPAVGNLGTNGIVGGGIPLATGAAFSARVRGTDQIAVCFFGDGALNQGLAHECMNMAAIWSLPVIFVCENNGFGEFTAIDDVTAGKDLLARGRVFDIPSASADGMDALAVRAAILPAIERARNGEGPSFLMLYTYRFGGHHVADAQDYKDSAEADEWRRRDPIIKLEQYMTERNLASAASLLSIVEDVKAEVKAAVRFARASAEPAAQALWSDVVG